MGEAPYEKTAGINADTPTRMGGRREAGRVDERTPKYALAVQTCAVSSVERWIGRERFACGCALTMRGTASEPTVNRSKTMHRLR